MPLTPRDTMSFRFVIDNIIFFRRTNARNGLNVDDIKEMYCINWTCSWLNQSIEMDRNIKSVLFVFFYFNVQLIQLNLADDVGPFITLDSFVVCEFYFSEFCVFFLSIDRCSTTFTTKKRSSSKKIANTLITKWMLWKKMKNRTFSLSMQQLIWNMT